MELGKKMLRTTTEMLNGRETKEREARSYREKSSEQRLKRQREEKPTKHNVRKERHRAEEKEAKVDICTPPIFCLPGFLDTHLKQRKIIFESP